MKNKGVEIESYDDTMLISYVLDAGLNRHSMDILSEIHLGHKTITYKELVGSGKNKIDFVDMKQKTANLVILNFKNKFKCSIETRDYKVTNGMRM